MSKAVKSKRVGKGRAGHKASAPRPNDQPLPDSATQEWPQVGDGVRFHKGAAAGWGFGHVEYRTDHGDVVARLEDGTTVALPKGQYEPVDGFLPGNRHIAIEGTRDTIQPVIGPPGPVLVEKGTGIGSMPAGAGQTLPQGRHLAPTSTGAASVGKDRGPNEGPSFTAGGPPAAGTELINTPLPAHPTPTIKKKMEEGKTHREALDETNAAANKATGKIG